MYNNYALILKFLILVYMTNIIDKMDQHNIKIRMMFLGGYNKTPI